MNGMKCWAWGVLLVVLAGPVGADQPEPPQIIVEGRSEVLLEPDYVEWVVDIRTRNEVPKIAREVNQRLFDLLMDIADKAKIDEKEINAGQPVVEQEFGQNSRTTPDIEDYRTTVVHRRVTLIMRDMDELDEMVDAVHPLGVIYTVRRKSSLHDETVRRVSQAALKEARTQAVEQAAALGQNIGKAIEVEVTRVAQHRGAGGLFGSGPAMSDEDDEVSAGPDGKVRIAAYAYARFRLE